MALALWKVFSRSRVRAPEADLHTQGIFTKAAVLLRSITLDHPFLDGNKRMGIAAALAFLSANDQIVVASDEELIQIAIEIATGRRKQLDDLSDWLRRRSLPFSQIAESHREDRVAELAARLPGGLTLHRPLLDLLVEHLDAAGA